MAAGGEHGNERHQAALRRDHVVELRDQGLTFEEIGHDLGVSTSRAWQLYRRALAERPVVAAHLERRERALNAQLERIAMQREVHEATVLAAFKMISHDGEVLEVEDPAPLQAATAALVKLDDQEAKLLGLYAKTEVDVTGGLRIELRNADVADI